MASRMPCSTPTTTTTIAVVAATANSPMRTLKISTIPEILTRRSPIRKTTEARTASGMYWSGLLRKRRTMITMPHVTSDDSWVRPPAPSSISVLVGLPLTTKVPENPAPRLARPRPTRSTFSLNGSLYFMA